ncbi:Uncharacterised protein [Mycobacteroides abscessus]|nr:Uncharacterised protein [Mycobacteroides abscessus]SKK67825.1 Uncharacterised protein [Mycobacteroides abscessus subsp. massiliense]SKQ42561.1 Uncharacterised protein [Mycobacteroides abscessus subsp. massiliense]SKW99028.1 Uncharacterised protein [Mycobacteroides abscessus subsp. massiliense]
MVGTDEMLVSPAREYLAFLRDQGAAPNTVTSNAVVTDRDSGVDARGYAALYL